MGTMPGEGYCLCRLNLSWPFAPVEEQLCPKGSTGEGVVGFPLPSLPAGPAGGHRLCLGSGWPVALSMGPATCQWGPGMGGEGGCGISYGPSLPALPHGYNEPLISTDLIKGWLLTGGWGGPGLCAGAADPPELLSGNGWPG